MPHAVMGFALCDHGCCRKGRLSPARTWSGQRWATRSSLEFRQMAPMEYAGAMLTCSMRHIRSRAKWAARMTGHCLGDRPNIRAPNMHTYTTVLQSVGWCS